MIKRALAALTAALLILAGVLLAAGSPATAGTLTPPASGKGDKVMHTPNRLAKHAPPTSGPHTLLGTPYWYSGAHQDLTSISPAVTTTGGNVGGSSSWYLDSTNDGHTLVETAVRQTYNSNATVIEAGVTVDPTLNGNSSPTLFVYYWDKFGVGQGYNTNFTLYASRTYTPGSSVITSTLAFQWVYSSGLWWLAVGGTWVGYFNTTLWPSVTFDHAAEWLGFDEVAQKSGGTRTYSCSDMRNGLEGSNASALGITSVSYNSSGTGVNLSLIDNPSDGYSPALFTGSTRSFRSGGAGTDSSGSLPGSVGSC